MKENKVKNTDFITIKNCARCSDNHPDLEFRRFIYNPVEDSDGTTWDYWGICPQTGEPILLKVSYSKKSLELI